MNGEPMEIAVEPPGTHARAAKMQKQAGPISK